MLPRWHVFWGAVFTALLWIFVPSISWIYLSCLFLSSFLIDFDHYLAAVFHTKKLSFFHALNYHDEMAKIENEEYKRGILKRGDFHLFHTIEFHLAIAIIGIFFTPFLFIFMGMVFHSLLDVLWLVTHNRMHRREFLLIRHLGLGKHK
mgnify:CR=1 FL=1